MLFSVVILSYNSERTLDRCLTSLTASLSQFEEPSEVFVIDNNSQDASRDILAKHEAENLAIKPILFPTNTGTTLSRNAGLKKAQGEYILILDSDAYMTPACLSGLKARLDSDPQIGLACPRLTYADGRHQLSTDQFPTPQRKVERVLNLSGISEADTPASGDVDYAISACWLLRRDTVDAVGGFDEAIFYAPEDVDYCIRIWLAGFRIFYDADESMTMVHDAQELSRKFKITKFHIEHVKGLWYLFNKFDCLFSLSKLRARIAIAQQEWAENNTVKKQ